MNGRKSKWRDNHPMAVLGVPNVGVLKPVHVDVETVGVHVHVGNKEMSDKPSAPPSLEYSRDCILFGTSKFSGSSRQLAIFYFEKRIHSFAIRQLADDETLE
jgi:hypothetical protein